MMSVSGGGIGTEEEDVAIKFVPKCLLGRCTLVIVHRHPIIDISDCHPFRWKAALGL